MKDSKLPKVIYIMGAPGSGKGTQANLLAKKLGYYQFSTGAAFRDIAQQDTELGRAVKARIDNGILCEPELAAEVVKQAIQEHLSKGQGLVFDGTPRTVKEAQLVDDFFAEKKYGQPLAIYLTVDQADMVARNSHRRYCLGVKPDFPILNKTDEMRCRENGGTIAARPDDDSTKFATRWQQFQENTVPVIEQYRAKGWLKEIDGKQTIEQVQHTIGRFIESLQK